MADNYENFKKSVLSLCGINLGAYKENQMKRRIDSLIARNRVDGYNSFVDLIRNDRSKLDEFVGFITINVSEFWRNPEQWEILQNKLLPDIIKDDGVKVWSAACSTGDEPYSLAMLLNSYLPTSKIKIHATDIDKQVLAKARSGIYSEKSIKGLPESFRRKYFVHLGDGAYEISEEIRKCVFFKEHDLLSSIYPMDFDLIVCRNVLIYFTDEAKDGIIRRFYRSLKTNGVLFLGSTEQILYPKELGFVPISSFFYKKL